jgi:hypothetical protein
MGNRSIGNAAAGGMLAGTLFGIFLVPALYGLFLYRRPKKLKQPVPLSEKETGVVNNEKSVQ